MTGGVVGLVVVTVVVEVGLVKGVGVVVIGVDGAVGVVGVVGEGIVMGLEGVVIGVEGDVMGVGSVAVGVVSPVAVVADVGCILVGVAVGRGAVIKLVVSTHETADNFSQLRHADQLQI